MHNVKIAVLKIASQLAQKHNLRQKAVCYLLRSNMLLVFEHVPDGGSGVQVIAGGLEPGESAQAAALREVAEETGQHGANSPRYLGSAAWLNEQYNKREMRHFFALNAPITWPVSWQNIADGHLFSFSWCLVAEANIDWDMDLFVPELLLMIE